MRGLAQGLAAGLVTMGLFVSCVSSETPVNNNDDYYTSADNGLDGDVGSEEVMYGEITDGLDSPLWDEGDGSRDNLIDKALSQSPFKGGAQGEAYWVRSQSTSNKSTAAKKQPSKKRGESNKAGSKSKSKPNANASSKKVTSQKAP
jgi:hypothetical protein